MTTRTLKCGVYVFVLLLTLLNAYVFIHPVTAQTDPAVSVDFRQCADNDITHGFTADECHWINSIIQSSNSIYFEGNSVNQRIILTNLDGTTHTYTLQFEHQFTKAGVHAYDFLTSYVGGDGSLDLNQGNGPALTNGLDPCGSDIDAVGTICNNIHTSAHTAVAPIPTDSFLSNNGGSCTSPTDSVSTKITAFEAAFPATPREVKIFGDAAITGAAVAAPQHVTSNGGALADCGDTGDSYTAYSLSWTTSSTSVLIELAGHLAVGLDTGFAWGAGEGSSSISGGPYHFKLMSLLVDASSKSLGSQDNPMQGATILVPPPSGTAVIQVSKEITTLGTPDATFAFQGSNQNGGSTTPDITQVFHITTSGGSGGASFDVTFSDTTYSVIITELTPPTGYGFVGAVCSVSNNGVPGANQDPTAGISIDRPDTGSVVVSCVFQNTGPVPIPEYSAGLALLIVALPAIYVAMRRKIR